MQKKDFYFDLPQELIAQDPLPKRTDSRLLVYHRKKQTYDHCYFKNLSLFLEPGDLLVLNDTKVMPARLYGNKASGGRIELLMERLLDQQNFLAQIRASKAPKANTIIHLQNDWQIKIKDKIDDFYHCHISNKDVFKMLEEIGKIPLPPYIKREVRTSDLKRYQTVYASNQGSVAAPTAGLHFDKKLLKILQAKGVNIAYATLHIGSGTFKPLRCDNLKEHKMHKEHFTINNELVEAIKSTKSKGGRVIAVGTTVMRSLESAIENNELRPCSKDTDIFIYPGYNFQVCDGLITNFHLPESTLIVLVAAFIGYSEAMSLYYEAILHRYRFFSYGDASLLL